MRRPPSVASNFIVRPEIAAPDAGAGDADHRVGRLDDGVVGTFSIRTSPARYMTVAPRSFRKGSAASGREELRRIALAFDVELGQGLPDLDEIAGGQLDV